MKSIAKCLAVVLALTSTLAFGASTFYPTAKKKIADGTLVYNTDTINCVMLLATYTPVATDEFLSAVANTNRVGNNNLISAGGTATTLAGKSTTIASSAVEFRATTPVVFTTVAASIGNVDKLLCYKDTGVETTSPLLAWIEFTAVDPNGGTINVNLTGGGGYVVRLAMSDLPAPGGARYARHFRPHRHERFTNRRYRRWA